MVLNMVCAGARASAASGAVDQLGARMAGPTRYWLRQWLPRLGWERWFLVTVLRWMHEEDGGELVDGAAGEAKATVEFTVPSLARRLGMSEKALYRLLKSEKVEDGTSWRRLAVRETAKNPRAGEQVTMLRRFIPRLRYTAEYDEERGTTVRRGMAVEIVLGDTLTAPDAERMDLPPDTTVSQVRRDSEPGSVDGDDGRGALIVETRPCGWVQTAETGNGRPQRAVSGKVIRTDLPQECPGIPARAHVCSDDEALVSGFPIQPVGINAPVAFNLALDKATALIPDLPGADSALYTLAAELQDAGWRQPSRTWPHAGGAGWVLDAVQDALGAGQEVRSVRLIRAITDRWRAEGSPYALDDLGAVPAGRALAAAWRAAMGHALDPEGLGRLEDVVASGRASLVEVLTVISEAGRREEALTAVDIEAILAGDMPMPALVPEEMPKTVVAQAPPRASEGESLPDDPVLGQVTTWYLSGVSSRMTALTSEELRDLTHEQRDLDVWEYAFERAKHIGNSLGRWHYVRKVVLDPDMDRVRHWLQSGKRQFKSKGDRNGRRRRKGYAMRERSGRADRWSEDDV